MKCWSYTSLRNGLAAWIRKFLAPWRLREEPSLACGCSRQGEASTVPSQEFGHAGDFYELQSISWTVPGPPKYTKQALEWSPRHDRQAARKDPPGSSAHQLVATLGGPSDVCMCVRLCCLGHAASLATVIIIHLKRSGRETTRDIAADMLQKVCQQVVRLEKRAWSSTRFLSD